MRHNFKFLCSTFLKFISRFPQLLRDKGGITLVEVIISIAVLGSVIVPLMNLFVMSAQINHESNMEFTSILTAQRYLEEVLSTVNIDTNKYVYNSEDGSYERTVLQTGNEFGAKIKITPKRSHLFVVEVVVMDNGEIINFLTGSKLIP